WPANRSLRALHAPGPAPYILFEHGRIDHEFRGPVRIDPRIVGSVDRIRAFDRSANVRIAIHFELPAHESIRGECGVEASPRARELPEQHPIRRVLRLTRETRPIDGAVPIAIEPARQEPAGQQRRYHAVAGCYRCR